MISKSLTGTLGSVIIIMNSTYEKKYVESEQEIRTYLDRLQYAIENGSATINLQEKRQVDKDRPKKYTNRYTLSKLFPDEDLVEALKKELIKLTVEEYIETVKDTRYPDRSDMRVFGKKYQEEDVYIKIRVELVSLSYANNSYIFVMSFHFAEKAFNESAFHIGKVEVKIVKKIKSEEKLCLICMTEHEVDTVEVIETEIYKDEEISFVATYEYCSLADEYLEKEEMIKLNDLAMKDAYRRKMDLLTSDEIVKIREKYGVSQKDFSEILGWGKATITRYENHQVQDRAHDDVLRKIDSAPNWFLEMLNRARGRISDKAFDKYYRIANEQYKKKSNQYLIDAIQANYADFDIESFNGGVKLNLNKVVEMINYLAAKVESLHKVKLMKSIMSMDRTLVSPIISCLKDTSTS
jgi:putative zinc finger/helix-turn-helix YgiT family protein